VYCALHAWQVTFIAGATVPTLFTICPNMQVF
jgi:hypothetical protein